MRTFLAGIDSWVLSLCEKFSHWFQEVTGRTNYFIAWLGVMAASIGTILHIINHFNKFLLIPTSFSRTFVLAVANLLLFLFAVEVSNLDKQSSSEERTGSWLIEILSPCFGLRLL